MDAWELTADLRKIEQQWRYLARVLEDGDLFERTDTEVSDWSCGQHVGHAVLIAKTMAGRIDANLADPTRHSEEKTPGDALRVLTRGGFTRGAARAPSAARPEGRGQDELQSLLHVAVEAWARIAARVDELPACRARAEHFALGYLTSTEWVRMCAVHTAHHLRIVRDIAGEGTLVGVEAGGDS
jgi:hypothetical protein